MQDQSALKSKQKEIEKMQEGYEKLVEQSKNDKQAHADAQKHFHAVSAGLSKNKDGEDASLSDQLMSK